MDVFLTTISEYFVQSIATILFLPIWVILMIFVNAVIPFIASKKMTLNLTLGAGALSIIFAALSVFYCLKNPQALVENNITWLNADIQVSFGTIVDNLSASMLIFISVINFLVQLFSYGYIKDDKSFHRYYIYLNLLAFSMYGLVLASNAVQTYVFWELNAVVSYLLIGFWYQKRSTTRSARKVFIINRLGDICLFLGIIALVYFSVVFNPAQNIVLLSYSTLQFTAETLYSMVTEPAFLIISILIFIGAMVKSAQFPFQSWLASSTEAPVPAAALLNSVGITAAGVFLCARFYPVFILSKTAMSVITVVGIVSALVCAYIAMSQNDCKKILVYSTSSQLGLVFAGLGLGAFSAAMFHLYMHGISKSLLFLSVGSVIIALNNESDIRYMGGMRKKLPLSAFAFLIGAASLCGVLFSGFYSLNLIFVENIECGNEFLTGVIILIVFMSAFYLFRAYFLVFEGKSRFGFESRAVNWTMKISVALLSLLVIFAGYILKNNFGKFVYFIVPENTSQLYSTQVVLTLFAVLGAVYIAYNLYVSGNNTFVLLKEKTLKKSNLPYKLSYNALYLDKISYWFVNSVILRLCRFWDFVEKYIVDGFVVIFALTTRVFSYIVSKMQTGNVQSYIAYTVFVLCAVMLVVAFLYICGSLMGV